MRGNGECSTGEHGLAAERGNRSAMRGSRGCSAKNLEMQWVNGEGSAVRGSRSCSGGKSGGSAGEPGVQCGETKEVQYAGVAVRASRVCRARALTTNE